MTFTEPIYNQNPWFRDREHLKNDVHLLQLREHKYVWRWNEFLDFSFDDGVYVVTGPRQIGKSTHLKLLIEKYLTADTHKNFFYFNCDLLDTKQELALVVEEYLKTIARKDQRIYVLLDDITALKDGMLAVKYVVDQGLKRGITYIITGSSSVHLKKTGEHLPGRKGRGKEFHLLPMTFRDYLSLVHRDVFASVASAVAERDLSELYHAHVRRLPLARAFQDFLHCGGIPRVINAYHVRNAIAPDVFETYRSWIRSEVAKHEKQERYVKIILDRMVRSLGSDVSYNAITQDAGIGSHNTVYEYLAFLEDSFVIRQLYHYDPAQHKVNVRKNKKLYFYDIFLYWLTDEWIKGKTVQDFFALKDDVLTGPLVENVVAGELVRRFGEDLYYTRPHEEIDFVSQGAAWEVKYQNRISAADVKHLLAFPGKRYVLSKHTFKVEPEYLVLPVEFYLAVMDRLQKP